MKPALALLAGLVLSACSGDYPTRTTSSPPPPLPSSAPFVWIMVVTVDGNCIAGATVQVVAGQRLGESLVQDHPCDPWDYGGGAFFNNLEAGVAMTIRAAAPGYTSQERTYIPRAEPHGADGITLSRSQ